MIKFLQLLAQLVNTKRQNINVQADSTDIDIEQALQRLALRKIFQQQQFSVLDGLNEYDEDFSSFSARGELITHDMMRTAKRLIQEQDQVTDINNEAVTQDLNRDDAKSV